MSGKTIDVNTEYSGNPNLSREDVKKLMRWIDSQPHLPKITEFQAVTFLHCTYHDLEAAKMTAEHFFTCRTLYSYLFDPLEDEDVLRETLTWEFLKILPDKTPDGDSILACGLLNTSPAKFDFLIYQKLFDMVVMSDLYNFGTCNGLIQVHNMAGIRFGHVFKISLKMVKHAAEYLQNGLPMRLKQIHIINMSAVGQVMIKMLRPFISNKLFDLMIFHSGDNKTIYDYIPQEILPKEFNGTGKSMRELQEGQFKELIENMDLFRWLQTQKVDEHERLSR